MPCLASAEELSFLQANPELKATLLQWEEEAPPEVKAEIKVLRTGDAEAKATAANRLAKMHDKAKGATLALLESLRDRTSVHWKERNFPHSESSPAGEAIDALAHMPAAFDAVVAGLKDTDPGVRELAAETLGLVRDIRAVEPLLAALKHFGSGSIGSGIQASDAAARALDETEPKWRQGRPANRVVPEFVAALGDRYTDVRTGAAWALGQIRDARAVGPLIQALRDANALVRASAAWALGEIRDASAVEPLIGALHDPDKWARELAADALQRIDPKWGRGEPATQAVPGFLAALRDQDEDMRVFAALLLGYLKDVRAVEPLIATLKDPQPEVRGVAAGALGDIGEARAVEPLISTLADPQSSVRRTAVMALGQIRDLRAVEPLVGALGDQEEYVRKAAAEALNKITGQEFGLNQEAWMHWWKAQNDRPAAAGG